MNMKLVTTTITSIRGIKTQYLRLVTDLSIDYHGLLEPIKDFFCMHKSSFQDDTMFLYLPKIQVPMMNIFQLLAYHGGMSS
jgi:hypothetical protein